MNASWVYKKALKEMPGKIAVAVDNESLSYEELDKKANKVTLFLKSMGIKKGDKIGFFM